MEFSKEGGIPKELLDKFLRNFCRNLRETPRGIAEELLVKFLRNSCRKSQGILNLFLIEFPRNSWRNSEKHKKEFLRNYWRHPWRASAGIPKELLDEFLRNSWKNPKKILKEFSGISWRNPNRHFWIDIWTSLWEILDETPIYCLKFKRSSGMNFRKKNLVRSFKGNLCFFRYFRRTNKKLLGWIPRGSSNKFFK